MPPIEHIVAEGEHLSGIAQAQGFSSIAPIWDHPDNAELKKLRKNPNLLLAGDRLIIPDRQSKEVAGATDQRHRFVTQGEPLELQLKVHDQGFNPLHGEAVLVTAAARVPMPQSGDIFKAALPRNLREASVEFPISASERQRPTLRVQPGRLDPIETMSGQQQRLNNLGYFAGFVKTQAVDAKHVEPQLRWAVEEFQCDHMGSAEADGVLGPKTLAKLKEVYGC